MTAPITVCDSSTGAEFASVNASDSADLERALNACEDATTDARDELVDLLVKGTGKLRREAFSEVAGTLYAARYSATLPRQLDGQAGWLHGIVLEVPSRGMKQAGPGRSRRLEGLRAFTEVRHVNFAPPVNQ